MPTKRTKALAISPKVREAVQERDSGQCIFCGSMNASPTCHFIRRSQGGLGIEENIWTGCISCHFAFDETAAYEEMVEYLRDYFKSKYPKWDESKLYYTKGELYEQGDYDRHTH
jgi:5-methylcytosine-specific restriction endonuclease McrA